MLKKYISVLMVLSLVLTLFCGCVNANDMSIVPGTVYSIEERLYSSPLSSFIGTPDITFTIKEYAVATEYKGSLKEYPVEKWGWEEFPYSEEEWKEMLFGLELFPIGGYGKIMYQPIDLFHFMLLADGEILFVQLFPDNQNVDHFWVWSIDKLKPIEE
ncbi:MAG: hypothetical protein IKJ57_02860 [Oscillospiraceae bacterium]|nr:hypothetical protein [Oscillospiraceae bacterium]